MKVVELGKCEGKEKKLLRTAEGQEEIRKRTIGKKLRGNRE